MNYCDTWQMMTRCCAGVLLSQRIIPQLAKTSAVPPVIRAASLQETTRGCAVDVNVRRRHSCNLKTSATLTLALVISASRPCRRWHGCHPVERCHVCCEDLARGATRTLLALSAWLPLTIAPHLSLSPSSLRRHSAGVGFVYPSYCSYRAIKQNATNTELVSRLTCWAFVAGATLLANCVFDPLLGFWIPAYYPAKVAFIAWLAFPQSGAAEMLLMRYIEPALFAVEDWFAELVTSNSPAAAVPTESPTIRQR
jgi:TB2/DP1, HVA22 family